MRSCLRGADQPQQVGFGEPPRAFDTPSARQHQRESCCRLRFHRDLDQSQLALVHATPIIQRGDPDVVLLAILPAGHPALGIAFDDATDFLLACHAAIVGNISRSVNMGSSDAYGQSYLARSAGCGAAQYAGAYGRDRLEGGGAVALALGGGDRTGHLLRDSTGARVCRGGCDSGNRVRGLVNPRRLGGVLQVSESGASKLCGALDPPLPGFGGSGDTVSGPVSVGRQATVGGRAGLAGPLSGAEDLTAGAVDGHRPAGSQAGPPAGAHL